MPAAREPYPRTADSVLPQQDALALIAEIAAAIAGFAALAGVFADRGDPTAQAFARLRVVVSSGLLLLLSAVGPIVVSDFGFSADATWWVCSLGAFGVNAFILYQGISRSVEVEVPLRDWSAYAIFWPTEAICQITLVCNILALAPSLAGSLYLAFLYAALVQTAWIFLELLDAAFHPSS